MRTIGLLGGMSWESSIVYERIINEGVRHALGGTASADLVMRSYNFTEIELLIGPDDRAVPFFATARLHAEAAVRMALGED